MSKGMKRRRKDNVAEDVSAPMLERLPLSKQSLSRSEIRSLVKKTLEKEEELKGIDNQMASTTAVAITADLTSTAASHLNQIDIGDSALNREGNEVKMKSLRIRGTFWLRTRHEDITGTYSGLTFRISVVLDRFPNQDGVGVPAWNSIFRGIYPTGTGFDNLSNGVHFGKGTRFKVLKDEIFTMSPDFQNTHGLSLNYTYKAQPWECFIPLKGLKAYYKATSGTGTYANMEKNALLVYIRCDANSAHVEGQYSSMTARLRFID